MRIVAGRYRGKKLIAPQGIDIRPTSDRAREAIFNILYSAIGGVEGKKVLDVFAGTGAFGLEALSRGAQSVCFIDKNIKTLQKNLNLFSLEKDKIKTICSDVSSLPKSNENYDLIFSDAPYDKGLNECAFESLLTKGFVKNGAWCLVETRHNEQLKMPSGFELLDERIYGMAKVWFYVFHI